MHDYHEVQNVSRGAAPERTADAGESPGNGRSTAVTLPARDIVLEVSLSDVFFGARRTVPLPCVNCGGTGHPGRGSEHASCAACGGKCADPAGAKVWVDVPPGVESGDRIPVCGASGEDDNLTAIIRVQDEEGQFRRRDNDVHLDHIISAELADLGGVVAISTLAGPQRLQVPPGVQTGHLQRIKGLGLPRSGRASFGDLVVHIEVADAPGAPGEDTPRLSQWIEEQELARPTWPDRRKITVAALLGIGGSAVVAAVVGASFLFGALRLLGVMTAVGFALLASLLLAATEKSLAATLINGRTRLRAFRTGVLARMSAAVAARSRAFVRARIAQPEPPLVVALNRLARSVEGAGRHEVAVLARLERRLADHSAALREVPALVDERNELVSQVTQTRPAGPLALAAVTIIGSLLLLVAGLNAWGLISFAPLPLEIAMGAVEPGNWQGARWLLPLAVSLGAASAGMLMYSGETPARKTTQYAPAPAPIVVPAVLILVMMLVQGIVFIPVAERVDLAGRMGIDAARAVYPLVQYSIVFVGALVPLVLAILGYVGWMHIERLLAGRSARRAARRLDRNSRALGATKRRLDDVVAQLDLLRAQAESMPRGLEGRFQEWLGLAVEQPPTLAGIVRGAAAELGRTGRIGGVAPAKRGPPEVLAGLLMDLLLLAAWLVIVAVLFRAFAAQLSASGILAIPDARAAAAGLAIALGVAGFVVRDALWGSSHLVLWSTTVPSAAGRKVAAVLAGAVLSAGALITAWIFAAERGVGPHAALGAAYGVILVLALAIASLRLDAGLVAAAHAARTAAFAIAWLGCMAAHGFTALLEGTLAAACALLRLATIPAHALRAKLDSARA